MHWLIERFKRTVAGPTTKIPENCWQRDGGGTSVDGVVAELERINAQARQADELTVLLQEHAECRGDIRVYLESMITLLGAGTALYGVLFYVIFGTTSAADSIPDLLWAYLPVIPMGLTGWLLWVGQQTAVRAEYLLRLEPAIWRVLPVKMLTEAGSGAPSEILVPATGHLTIPHTRANSKSTFSSKVLLTVGGVVLFSMVAIVIVASAVEIENTWLRIVTIGVYVTLSTFALTVLRKNVVRTDLLWQSSLLNTPPAS